jgi:hypothetical protein
MNHSADGVAFRPIRVFCRKNGKRLERNQLPQPAFFLAAGFLAGIGGRGWRRGG